MASKPITILVVDDSALYRQAIRNVLRDMPDVSIVGLAKNGIEALAKIEELDPDLLTLDVQMPDLDGIGVLKEINLRGLRAKAIMVSSLTREGAQVTTDALLEGAFDFILKPSGSDPGQNRRHLQEALGERIEAFAQGTEQVLCRPSAAPPEPEEPTLPGIACEAVCIGTSTGGPAALKAVLPKLPENFAVPVLIVQHMPKEYTRSLANRLNEMSPLTVCEAESGMALTPGAVLVAPGGHQMRVGRRAGRAIIEITDDPHENACRPAVDYTLRSAVTAFDGRILAVILTGMGRDGAAGCAEVKRQGGRVFAQHEGSCVVYGMPKAVIEDDLADRILPLERIAPAIVRHVQCGFGA